MEAMETAQEHRKQGTEAFKRKNYTVAEYQYSMVRALTCSTLGSLGGGVDLRNALSASILVNVCP